MGYEPQADFGTPAVHSETTVTLSIDGREVSVPTGTTVMRAAALSGGSIPKLCASDNLKQYGSCRLCLVEIDGMRGTPASCTTPAAQGMVVHTQTDKVQKLRRGSQGRDGASASRKGCRLAHVDESVVAEIQVERTVGVGSLGESLARVRTPIAIPESGTVAVSSQPEIMTGLLEVA